MLLDGFIPAQAGAGLHYHASANENDCMSVSCTQSIDLTIEQVDSFIDTLERGLAEDGRMVVSWFVYTMASA